MGSGWLRFIAPQVLNLLLLRSSPASTERFDGEFRNMLAVAQNRSNHTIDFPAHVQVESDALSDFHDENSESTGRRFRRA
jgi:hypothetical protein